MSNELRNAADNLAGELVGWRRHLHMHPELSGREEQTAGFVARSLRDMGYTPRERVGDTWGVVADIEVGGTSAVALRADMDALPIDEASDVPYVSQSPGAMHACGHDAHTAMLLGAARLIAERKSSLSRSVRLIFQPSEERWPGGAKPMIDAGVLDGVSSVFGLHVWSQLPAGTIGVRAGAFMASVCDLDITIRGKGGHAAMPNECVDPVVTAAEAILSLQTVISRGTGLSDNGVVSITQIEGGTASNVIPPSVRLCGTVRTLSDALRVEIERRIRQVVHGVAQAHGAEADVQIRQGYPVLVNDTGALETVIEAARSAGVREDQIVEMAAQGGGEDFAYFAQRLPSAFAFLGARNVEKGCVHPHHHPRFDIDEDVLPIGSALLAALATK